VALQKRFSPTSLEGMTIPADGLASDIHGSAEYRALRWRVALPRCRTRFPGDAIAKRP
jgi:hypothetical protein